MRRGVTCEDRFASKVCDDGTVLLAVSDGLGSAKHAATGAEAAASAAVRAGSAVVRAAPDFPPATLARHMLACARAHVVTLADAMGAAPGELACTLIAIVARPGEAAAAHIGDGAAIVEGDAGFEVLSGPPVREYINEVEPLTARDWARHVRVSVHDGALRSVSAFTDGCQHAALTARGEVGDRFIPAIVEHVRATGAGDDALHAVLSGSKINEHCDDDKTLVVALVGP